MSSQQAAIQSTQSVSVTVLRCELRVTRNIRLFELKHQINVKLTHWIFIFKGIFSQIN